MPIKLTEQDMAAERVIVWILGLFFSQAEKTSKASEVPCCRHWRQLLIGKQKKA
jgi:hypothetical protein